MTRQAETQRLAFAVYPGATPLIVVGHAYPLGCAKFQPTHAPRSRESAALSGHLKPLVTHALSISRWSAYHFNRRASATFRDVLELVW